MKGMLAVMATVAFVAGGWCGAADAENPYKKAKVGDWICHVQTTEMAAMNMKQTMTMKQTVKAKDEKEITISVEIEMNGQKRTSETKIALDQVYDPYTSGMPKGMNAKVEKVADGKETITVAGKSFDCTWGQVKMTMKNEQMDMAGDMKAWSCPDVPLHGLVKSESDMVVNAGGQQMKTHVVMELKDCGRGQ